MTKKRALVGGKERFINQWRIAKEVVVVMVEGRLERGKGSIVVEECGEYSSH